MSAKAFKPFYCGECGRPCDSVERDFGYGATEYWGAVSVDSNVQVVSECCDGDLFEDPELEEQVTFWCD